MTCPRCGLVVIGTGERPDEPDGYCSPFTSPACWWVRSLGVPPARAAHTAAQPGHVMTWWATEAWAHYREFSRCPLCDELIPWPPMPAMTWQGSIEATVQAALTAQAEHGEGLLREHFTTVHTSPVILAGAP